jgi:YD repeat-containing protein
MLKGMGLAWWSPRRFGRRLILDDCATRQIIPVISSSPLASWCLARSIEKPCQTSRLAAVAGDHELYLRPRFYNKPTSVTDGHLLQTQQSAGTVLRTTSTVYTLTGKLLTTTDGNGNVTRYAYDLDDRLTSVTVRHALTRGAASCEGCWAEGYPANCRIAITALRPPNAKEFDSAARTGRRRASFGTQSRSQAGSGPR